MGSSPSTHIEILANIFYIIKLASQFFLEFNLPESISSLGVSVSILVKEGDLIKDARFRAKFNLFLSNSPDVSILCTS